ncbi:MAG: hypothetical protein R3C03_17660 [Pirellulaceae bacterium]
MRWSPNGQLIACSGWGDNDVLAVIANQSGEILHQISLSKSLAEVAMRENLGHPMAFAWSPDSKSLCF